ncbi:MAM and LDL-receptor class A domain-containing protein 1-like [Centruroides sculpturatus]|uniref:MAM and LDL-receptor class A domain-containing protein 1-like n=1 Tax=Centruroides sculpturatus TaxID=218467 RepID=UPI000C6E4D6C|nr:MAM and LDL-receptor class A domain-containing protein 1-like [Centruroides sculpturatus]
MRGLLILIFFALQSYGSVIYPKNVNSDWEEWTTWSHCSVTCGNGVRYRFRERSERQKRNLMFPDDPDSEFEFLHNNISIYERQKSIPVQKQTKICTSICKETVFPYFCDFNNGTCHMTQDTRNDFDWSITKSNGSNDDEIDNDINRAFGINSGYYLSTERNTSERREKSRIITPWFPISKNGYCIQFWYNLNKMEVKLRIFIQIKSNESFGLRKIWEAEEDLGDFWLFDSVSLPIIDQQIRVIFEATIRRVGKVSLDDVTVKDRVCLERRRKIIVK